MNNMGERPGSSIQFSRRSLQGGFCYKLYDIVYAWVVLLANLIAPFHGKLREALKGKRKGVDGWEIGARDNRRCIMLHAASFGEFEGITPLIENLNDNDELKVAVSFSSPSAQKKVQATPGIWANGFLPYDFLYHQIRLLGELSPSVVLIAKHDFWPNTIRAAKVLNIPVILINANFHSGSRRNLPIVRWFHRAFMKQITAIWTVSKADSRRVEPLLSVRTRLEAIGDTRYDRVRQRADRGKTRFKDLQKALQPGPILIVGSSWQPGEIICYSAVSRFLWNNPGTKLVVVPHEPDSEAIDRNRRLAKAYDLDLFLLSEWNGDPIEENVLLVDKIGVLAELYAIGWAAYVGGGFGRGVHSVIEPAAHGIPVVFGPRHQVSHEASLLLKTGGGFVVKSTDNLYRLWKQWHEKPNSYEKAAKAADEVVRSREGATDRIMELLSPYLS